MQKTYKRIISLMETVSGTGVDTSGYAEISNTGTLAAFTGATVPALASATYDIDIEIDGSANALAVALLNTDSWTSIAAKIQTALRTATSSTETVAIVSGKIRVTSVTAGATSTVVISAGTTGSGGGDLLAAIDALGTTYVVSLDTPVDGTEGSIELVVTTSVPSDDFIFNFQVKSSAGVVTSGLKAVYSTTTGILTISDNGASELASGDEIHVIGTFL